MPRHREIGYAKDVEHLDRVEDQEGHHLGKQSQASWSEVLPFFMILHPVVPRPWIWNAYPSLSPCFVRLRVVPDGFGRSAVACIETEFPADLAVADGWQFELQVFVMGVDEQQECVITDRFSHAVYVI